VFGFSREAKKQLGMAVRMCMCLLWGRKQMKASRTRAWTHQQSEAMGTRLWARGEFSSRWATKLETGMNAAAGSLPRAISTPCRPK